MRPEAIVNQECDEKTCPDYEDCFEMRKHGFLDRCTEEEVFYNRPNKTPRKLIEKMIRRNEVHVE